MTVYSVSCPACGKENLYEQPAPMGDPGELPAFCNADCSEAYARRMFQPFIDQGAKLIKLNCGCLVCVFGTEGHGSTHPWPNCEAARGKENYLKHSQHIHETALEIVRRGNERNGDHHGAG